MSCLQCVCVCILVFRLSEGVFVFFFFKQKTAYEMRISDWSSDVCSSDLKWSDFAPAAQLATERACRGRARKRPAFRRRSVEQRRSQIGRASCRERVCQYV